MTGEENTTRKGGLIRSVVRPFLEPQLPILLVFGFLALGVVSLSITPREEDPQIEVTMADVFVRVPGSSASEVENLVMIPLERLLWQVQGVEHVYSVARRGRAMITVRFKVGEDREDALTRLQTQIRMHVDEVPQIVDRWIVKPVGIDDVPVLALTLYSERRSGPTLRRFAEEIMARMASQETLSRTSIVGGRRREVRVELDPTRLASRGLDPVAVTRALRVADVSMDAGDFDRDNRNWDVTLDAFFREAEEVRAIVIGVHDGETVRLGEVARVVDGPEEAEHFVRIGFSRRFWTEQQDAPGPAPSRPAVTLTFAKKSGTNAVEVVDDALRRLSELKASFLPDDVEVEITRNYGETAANKSSTLIQSLAFAVITVVVLLGIALGWREALVVALAVPLSFSGALFVSYLLGYTINRVTMFALIVSLGLIVDDPITNVDNIQRHVRESRTGPVEATLAAVQEVLPPVLISTLAIVVSFTPLFFISGMMGPYMAPMAADVPLTVGFSTLFALTVVPFVSLRLLRKTAGSAASGEGAVPVWIYDTYRTVVGPFLDRRPARWGLFVGVVLLLTASIALVLTRQVPVKILPFDDKNELQLVVDMPEGTPLEKTDRAVRAFEGHLRGIPEVTSFVSYVGTASPMDFNGLVRHYFLRSAEHEASIRINMASRKARAMQSHPIALRLRNALKEIADRHGVNLKIVERPPGPPVLATVVGQLSGPPGTSYNELIEAGRRLRDQMAKIPGVTDLDTSAIEPIQRLDFSVDREQAALHNITPGRLAKTLQIALEGSEVAQVHEPMERQALPVRVTVPVEERSHRRRLEDLRVAGRSGQLVPLGELGLWRQMPVDQPIMHKDLEPVMMVYADVVGRSPVTAVLDIQSCKDTGRAIEPAIVDWASEGEWQITLRVFRDLGIAFGAALVGIYVLLVVQTGSFFLPMILMLAIPLTLLGILPGFWLLNGIMGASAGGYATPVFFTATSMIGMIALGGIVIRNSVVLLDFVQNARRSGMTAREATLASGAVRMRPILLTAATTGLGVWPITFDPIFSGLAWALIFGLVASTLFSLVLVPVTYFAFYGREN